MEKQPQGASVQESVSNILSVNTAICRLITGVYVGTRQCHVLGCTWELETCTSELDSCTLELGTCSSELET
jgi:hypothetical protein